MHANHPDTDYALPGVAPTASPVFSWCDGPQPASTPSPRSKRADREPAPANQQDLCCICTYVSDCMYRGATEQPKQQCELFDVEVGALGLRASGRIAKEPGEEGVHDLKGGLCCNCESRRHCTIRKAEGDVWHCEEYC